MPTLHPVTPRFFVLLKLLYLLFTAPVRSQIAAPERSRAPFSDYHLQAHQESMVRPS
jgi:hypothetical protein